MRAQLLEMESKSCWLSSEPCATWRKRGITFIASDFCSSCWKKQFRHCCALATVCTSFHCWYSSCDRLSSAFLFFVSS